VQSDHVGHFSSGDETLLETLAQYATLVFQRDRLTSATNALAHVDFSGVNRADVMSAVVMSAADLVDADGAVLFTLSDVTNELSLVSHYPHSMDVSDLPEIIAREAEPWSRALYTGEVEVLEDLKANEMSGYQTFATKNGYSVGLVVPLLLHIGDTERLTELGTMCVFFHAPPLFADLDRRLLLAFAVSASYAIHNVAVIESSNRMHSLATITARTAAALELSSRLAQKAFEPLHAAATSVDALGQALRRKSIADASKPLAGLRASLHDLETLVAQLAPKEQFAGDLADSNDVLSGAFRLIHTSLFASSDRPYLNIGEVELWSQVQDALRRVIELVRLPFGAVFISTRRDYSDLRRVAVTRKDAPGPTTLTLASFEEFRWLAAQTHVILPREDGQLRWLRPGSLVGTPGAVIYGHEVTGGQLVVIALGVPEHRALTFEELATLYEAVVVQIFTYIDNAMFSIELDFLTSETGHLMGRAIGKVESGARVLKRVIASPADSDSQIVSLAESAVEDGLNRLHLIQNNFYWFSAQRQVLHAGGNAVVGGSDVNEVVDVCTMLRAMEALFRREAVERGLKPTRFTMHDRNGLVRGPEALLRLVFLNVYDNAIKFAYSNTFVTIEQRRKDSKCIVVFENLGVGVAPDEMKAVFERLRRSRFQDRSRRVEGLGLGLSYCRRVVEETFRGEIVLASRPAETSRPSRFEGDNWLTTVTVSLPLADARARG
jgi:signal transduction histidine kinase